METAKLIRKPLKGYAQTGFLEFDSISVNNIITSTGVNIVDQVEGDIINTNIGVGGPANGDFLNLRVYISTETYGDVQMFTTDLPNSTYLKWIDGVLSVKGDFNLNGAFTTTECAQIKKLSICEDINGSLLSNTTQAITLQAGSSVNIKSSLDVNNTSGSFTSLVGNTELFSIQQSRLNAVQDVFIQSNTENIFLNAGVTSASTAVTSGSIVLNAKDSVFVPKDIPIQLGESCNYMKGEIGGLILGTCNDMYLNLLPNKKIYIPSTVSIQFGNSVSNRLFYDNTKLNIYGDIIHNEGNITASGQYATYNINDIKMLDPILTIGGTAPLLNVDNKDRGLEYYYNKTGVSKMGWLGWKNNKNRFMFYSESVNNSEIISGTLGNIEINDLYTNNVIFQTQGTLDLQCGNVLNTKKITGCNGGLTIESSNDITVSTPGRLNLNTSSTLIPSNSKLLFNNTSSSISAQTSGELVLYAGSKIILDSNVQINGTMETVYSTIVNINDPIISIGGIEGATIDNNQDRGIEFYWYKDNQEKTGFFGFKDDTQTFVFIPNGTNNNEVFTGDYGDIQVGDIYSNDIYTDTINNLQSINTLNGSLTGIKTISGGSIEIKTTFGNLLLTPTQGSDVVLPYNTDLVFGNILNSISANTSNQLKLTSSNNIELTSGNSVVLNGSGGVYIGNQTNTGGSVLYFGNTEASITLTNGNLLIDPKANLIIPSQTELQLSENGINKLYSTNNQLNIVGGDAINLQSSKINIDGNTIINGNLSATNIETDNTPYIYPLGTYRLLDVTNIENSSSTGKLIITTQLANNLRVGDTIKLRATNSVPSIDGLYVIDSLVNQNQFVINSTSTVLTNGNKGVLRMSITSDPAKDVGIQVNWHTGATTGTLDSKTGFFGFKRNTERWTFFREGINNDNVFTGTLGNIEFSKGFAEKMSGFQLEGGLTAGNNLISGTNFNIGGGNINNTSIGQTAPSSGKFTNLTSTNESTFNNQTLLGNLNYSLEYIDLTTNTTSGSVSVDVILSFVTVENPNLNCELSIPDGKVDGQLKVIIASHIDDDSTYKLNFGANNLVTPFIPGGILNAPNYPSQILFKRQGQSISLIWNNRNKFWTPIGGNGGKVL